MLRYVIKLNCFVLFVLMFICLDTQLKSGVWASGGGPGACLQNMEGKTTLEYLGGGQGRLIDGFELRPPPMLCPIKKPCNEMP